MLEYRYPHFKRRLMIDDLSFHAGPKPGESMPDFDLPTTDGGRIRRSDFMGRRPVLITAGSITCPMTAASGDILKRLHREFGDRIEFVTLYVREAHPGDRYPQARTDEEKMRYAKAYEQRDGIPWVVAVDDVEGGGHRVLDGKPNSAVIMDADGRVVFRALWSNHERALKKALRTVVEQRRVAGESTSRLIPMLSGMGCQYEMLRDSGPTARRDVFRQAPPMYALARVAAIFRPLPPLGRTVAATATVAGAAAILWAAARRAWKAC